MGASVRPREFDVDQPSQTEQLANWIDRIRTKKIICRRNRRRNLRVEAVLTSVLCKAESELRSKQMSRIMRWQQMRQRLLEGESHKDEAFEDGDFQDGDVDHCKSSSDKAAAVAEAAAAANYYGAMYASQEQYGAWGDSSFCPELSSLDSFMSQISQIKVPVQR